jgi:leucyl/phenylalanyl-tRNA--protein transferase
MMIGHYMTGGHYRGSFLPVEKAFKHPDGLLSIGGPLSTSRLIYAYYNGIYPWCHISPIKWWAPRERMVLFLNETHLAKNLRKLIRRRTYRVTFDLAFREVIQACAEVRPKKLPLTWISPQIIEAYIRLHLAGYAHSVEVWDANDNLVGGLYGVAIGGIFYSESQFTRKTGASKVGDATLNCHLQKWGFELNDSKRYSEFLAATGSRFIKRAEFMRHLNKLRDRPNRQHPWVVDESLDVASWNPEAGIGSKK